MPFVNKTAPLRILSFITPSLDDIKVQHRLKIIVKIMENMLKVCRLCLKLQKKGNLVNIFGDGSNNISGFIYDIFQVHLEEVAGWPSEACKKCERLINEIRSFREGVYLAQSTLANSVGAQTTDTKDQVVSESVKQEEEMAEIRELPEVYFEDSDDGESDPGLQDEKFADIMKGEIDEVKPELDDLKGTPTKNRRNKKCTPPNRKQPRRSSKKDVVQKRNSCSPYSLDQEREMELQMKYMGWFKCCICSEELTSLKDLQKHFRTAHNAAGYILCCNGKRLLGLAAYEHLHYHQDPNAYECPLCKKVFRARFHVKLHMRELHGGPDAKIYKCDCCGKAFSSKGKLTGHMKAHVKPEKCGYCGRGFQGPGQLKRHVERMHEITNRVVCDICGKWFSNSHTLNNHLVRHNNQRNKKACPHCDKFVADLKQHVNVVHLGKRRGGVIRIPGLDSQGRPLDAEDSKDDV